MKSSIHNRYRGFSLIELSIVLVILGLLTGGILAGKSLIRAAELRSVTVDVTRYRAAALTFRDKYFYYAGDIPNATSFWGILAGSTGNDATCYDVYSAAVRNTTKTCNGNGDGAIGTFAVSQYESYLYWRDLALSGIIEGKYNGRGADDYGVTQIGCLQDPSLLGSTSCPVMRLANATIVPVYQFSTGDTDFVPYPPQNYYLLGNSTVNGVTNGVPLGAIVSTEEAWNMDTKIDDGLPYTGFFQSFYRTGATQWAATSANACASSATIIGATYDLTKTGVACSFRIRFN